MDTLILVTTVAASMTLAVVGARGMLTGVLHVMAHPPRPSSFAGDVRSSRHPFGGNV